MSTEVSRGRDTLEEASSTRTTALESVEASLRAAVDDMLEGVQIIDHDWRYVYLNRQAEAQSGRPPGELLGRVFQEEWPGIEDTELFRRMKCCMNDRTIERMENVFDFPDGSQGVFELIMQPVPEGILILSNNISESREAERLLAEKEEQLREAEKLEAVGLLAGGIAHEFNNKLTSILGFTEYLLSDPGLAGTSAIEDLRVIKEAADRAAYLTRELLALSRRQVMKTAVVSISDLVGELEPAFRSVLGSESAPSKGSAPSGERELVLSLDPGAGRVEVDARQIERLIDHLVTNARDAMPRGGTLVIETAGVELDRRSAEAMQIGPGAYALLTVSDNGVGISPEAMAHLFEPFYTTKPQGQGTGLGLPVVRGIVKQNRGGIAVTSKPGNGTVIRVYLPRVADSGV
jgi:PAS domain S-box-containing protein